MSSHSADQFSPPQSTQPYPFQSIFGGPSGQYVDSQSPPGNQQAAFKEETEDEDAVDLEEVLPPIEGIIDQSDSDDATYHETDREEEAGFRSGNETTASVKDDEQNGGHNEDIGNQSTTSRIKRNNIDKPFYASSPPLPSLSSAYRLNRFSGPEPTWRNLTLEDRQNAQALETIRARDLSAHLYNAYALRVRAREIARKVVGGTNKRKQDEAGYFVPPRRWSAWPMSADEVPRPDEHLRRQNDDIWTLRMQPDLRPSAELEESLTAVMLKVAKRRFEARGWEDSESGPAASSTLEQSNWVDDDRHENTEDDEWDCKSDSDSVDEAPLYPVVQADDEKSRRQLQPLARGIITQVDQLLMGLHHARRNDMIPDDASVGERNTDATESEDSGMSRPQKKRAGTDMDRSRSRARKRTRKSRGSISDVDPDTATDANVPRSRRGYASSARLEFRDWSQVLGLASMIGLPSAAVMRAAQRCSSLFGEDMEFRTFREGYVRRVEGDEEAPAWVYSENESEEDDLDYELAPLSSPPRPSRRSQSRHRGQRSRQLSSRRAGSSAPESGITVTPSASHATVPPALTHRHESQTEMAIPANAPTGVKGKGKGEHRRLDIICPIEGCPRRRQGFSRTWNLNLHLKRVHPGYIKRDPDANIVSPVGLSSDDEME